MKRTITQNAALHKYFELLAKELNDAGYDVGTTIKVPVDFTKDTVKKYMAKPVMTALHPDIEHTSDLDTTQISELYEHLNRLTAEKFGVSVPWPSYDEQRIESLVNEKV